jgi:hypothetical protein
VRTAVQLARECYAIASSSLHRTHRILLESKLFLADALRYAGQLTESEAFYRDVLQMAGSTFAPDDAFMLVCWANFASFLERQGNFDEMEKTMRAVVLATSLTVGIEATNVLGFGGRYMLSRCLLRKGKYLECETESRQVLTAQKKLLGRDRKQISEFLIGNMYALPPNDIRSHSLRRLRNSFTAIWFFPYQVLHKLTMAYFRPRNHGYPGITH